MYSFAVILWEIATNKIPFVGLSPMNIGIKVCICIPSRVSIRETYTQINVFGIEIQDTS